MTPNSRSYLNRFSQPDSIVPNLFNPQNLNRYGYVSNNPVNAIDPSGHASCNDIPNRQARKYCLDHNGGGGFDDPWKDITLFLVCGEDMVRDCQPKQGATYAQWGYPDNKQPLTPERDWAEENGIPYYYYATGDDDLTAVENSIVQQMQDIYKQNQNSQFIVIGFSGGAPFATGIATAAIGGGIPGSSLQVIELDSWINGSNTTQKIIDSLISQPNNVKFSVFNSVQYQGYQEKYNRFNPWIGWLVPVGVNQPSQTIQTTAETHQELAVDQSVFVHYILPVLP